jgi:hypothetical protein
MNAKQQCAPEHLAARFAGALVAAALCACGGTTHEAATGVDKGGGVADGGRTEDGSPSASCPPCVTSGDCGGGVCAQLGGDTYCAPACSAGACSADRQCATVSDVSGNQVSVCVPRGGVCSVASSQADAGGVPGETCGTLVGPDVAAACHCGTGQPCSANGCYGGWWCNTANTRCQAPPTTCGGTSSGGGPYDGGAPPAGSIGPSGGSVSRLYFAIVGDTRPASEDDTAGYPTPVITQIYEHIEALSPRPTFAVSTGDYQFAAPGGTEGATQLDLYLGARAKYSGVLFPTMGNHECTGYTASNCGSGNPDGVTNNYTAYLSKLLAPIHQASPYYEIDVNGSDGSWTAKYLFVAANAWTQTQATWLDMAMARATTYTFVVRHEAASANTAPGVTPSENILRNHPYTLAIVGHTHTYERTGQREVIVGNGGAPLSGSKNYGFGMVSQSADGSVAVDMIDYASGQADGSFHFAVKADGSAAP